MTDVKLFVGSPKSFFASDSQFFQEAILVGMCPPAFAVWATVCEQGW